MKFILMLFLLVGCGTDDIKVLKKDPIPPEERYFAADLKVYYDNFLEDASHYEVTTFESDLLNIRWIPNTNNGSTVVGSCVVYYDYDPSFSSIRIKKDSWLISNESFVRICYLSRIRTLFARIKT